MKKYTERDDVTTEFYQTFGELSLSFKVFWENEFQIILQLYEKEA